MPGKIVFFLSLQGYRHGKLANMIAYVVRQYKRIIFTEEGEILHIVEYSRLDAASLANDYLCKINKALHHIYFFQALNQIDYQYQGLRVRLAGYNYHRN
jgi:hypothetical protein